MKSTGISSQKFENVTKALADADAVLVGAGAGLSTAAGFDYAGERFQRYFADFAKKYGYNDMYAGGFYPYESLEEFWGFWSAQIMVNRYMDAPKPVYERVLELVRDKPHFALTTNVDHCFQKAGWDKKRLFYTQGDFGLFQCSGPCRQETFDNEAEIREMVDRQKDLKIPTELVPHCPHCGRPMTTNLRIDDKFVEDDGWHAASQRYSDFLEKHALGKIVLLELGVGFNTPAIIKYPFWRLAAENPNAVYVCINQGEAVCPVEIKKQAVCIDSDIGDAVEALLARKAV